MSFKAHRICQMHETNHSASVSGAELANAVDRQRHVETAQDRFVYSHRSGASFEPLRYPVRLGKSATTQSKLGVYPPTCLRSIACPLPPLPNLRLCSPGDSTRVRLQFNYGANTLRGTTMHGLTFEWDDAKNIEKPP